MEYLLISLKDRAVDAFQPVANVRAEGEALRVFRDLIADPNSQQHRHPDDYDLYLVGYFNDQTGAIRIEFRKLADGKTIKEMTA